MVDNRDNWEDTEYTDEQAENLSYDYEDTYQESDDYSEQSDYSEYEEDEDYEEKQKKNNPVPMLILLIILLGIAAFIALPKLMPGHDMSGKMTAYSDMKETMESQSTEDLTNEFFEGASDTSDMISVDFNENGDANVATGEGENSEIAIVTSATAEEAASASDLFEEETIASDIEQEENNSIMVVYNKAARLNPFKPPTFDGSMSEEYGVVDNTQFEIIEPPVDSVPDENLTRLLQTQISGILYEEESPSAIVNINGSDQFVKIGDVVFGYKIQNITRNNVEISYKNNSYVASVGELFTKGSLEKNPAIVNFENKFAGRNIKESN